MPVVNDLLDALITLVSSVPQVGNVYPHYKYSSNWDNFLNQFVWIDTHGNKIVLGWWFSIPPVSTGRFSTFDEPTDAYDWTLRGIMTVSDKNDSESDFMNLIYLVRQTLRTSMTLGLGGEVVVPGTVTCEISIADLRMFGSVLTHYTELRIRMEASSGITQEDYTL
jgi:hypothetical protein